MKRNASKNRFRWLLIIMTLLFAGIFSTQSSFAASWHDVYLKNGETYNLSKAKANTTVYINETGNFTLKGKSSKVRILVNSTDATIYLADGLTMEPGVLTNVGQRTASIEIADNGGTVRLITKANAKVSFGGYFGMPAIMKEGVKTKLVFDTEDAKKPGTLTAKSAAFSDSPGIGSSGKGIIARNVWTGNIAINGGIIFATGAGNAAGIGGCSVGHLKNFVVNGGEVIAKGGTKAAGIGGGYRGSARDLYFYGGSVKTYGGEGGAGIGTGASDGEHGFKPSVKNIIIDGGTVYAEGGGSGAAIGGGCEADADKIHIYKGSVTAIGGNVGGTGIGGGNGNYFGTGSDIKITGGLVHVTVDDEATAIGSSSTGNGKTTINITGGTVTTNGGENSIGIGGGGQGSVANDYGTTTVMISGGTITIKGNTRLDIGSDRNPDSSVYITGGSVNADTVKGEAMDGAGNCVYKTTIALDGMKWSQKVTEADIKNAIGGLRDYGLNDIWTDVNKLYFWLPKADAVHSVTVNERNIPLYQGNVESGQAGTLYPAQPELYKYQIVFEGNAPEKASGILTGTMEAQTLSKDEETSLTKNQYRLKGYAFAGWNTKPDGSGTAYVDEQDVKNLADKDGSIITLYAQWKAEAYKILFQPGEGTGEESEQVLHYDESSNLRANTFSAPAGKVFAGWKRAGALGGSLYGDQAAVRNLCNYNENSGQITGYVLEAQWIYDGNAVIQILLDGQMGAMEVGEVCVKSGDGSLNYKFDQQEQGFYVHPRSHIAEGTYEIYIDHVKLHDAKLEVTEDTAFAQVQYYTVVVEDNAHLYDDAAGIQIVEAGEQLSISATEKGTCGCAFDRWNVLEGQVQFADGDMTKRETVISIYGKTVIKPLAKEQFCQVIFDKNLPKAASGEITGEMTDGSIGNHGTALSKNQYDLEGYAFAGWNTEADGSGTAYRDEEVVRFDVTDGSSMILYAQWKPCIYTLIYEANVGGDGVMDTKQCIYDQELVLDKNRFEKPDYHFVGWNKAFDGSGTWYQPGDKVKNLSAERFDMVYLFAQWEHDSYTIKYDANGGVGYMPDDKIEAGESIFLQGCGFGKEGYEAIGWNTKADGNGTAYDLEALVKDLGGNEDEIVLYAQWKESSQPPEEEPTGPLEPETPAGPKESDEDKTEFQDKTEKPDKTATSPETGDENTIWFYLGAIGVAGILLAGIYRRRYF